MFMIVVPDARLVNTSDNLTGYSLKDIIEIPGPSWRPPNYKNPHPKSHMSGRWGVGLIDNPDYYTYEAGFSAALKALGKTR